MLFDRFEEKKKEKNVSANHIFKSLWNNNNNKMKMEKDEAILIFNKS